MRLLKPYLVLAGVFWLPALVAFLVVSFLPVDHHDLLANVSFFVALVVVPVTFLAGAASMVAVAVIQVVQHVLRRRSGAQKGRSGSPSG